MDRLEYYTELSVDADDSVEKMFPEMDLEDLRDLANALDEDCGSDGGQTRSLSSALYFIFLKTTAIENLLMAIDKANKALEAVPDDQDYTPRMKDVIVMLLKLYEHTDSLESLQIAISKAIEVMTATPLGHPDFIPRVQDLLMMMGLKAYHTCEDGDLDAAKFAADTLSAAIGNKKFSEVRPEGNVTDSLAKFDLRGCFGSAQKDTGFCRLCKRLKFDRLLYAWNRAHRGRFPWILMEDPEYRVSHARTLASLRSSAGICNLCGVILESLTSSVSFREINSAERLPVSLSLKSLEDGDGFSNLSLWLGNESLSNLHIAVEEEGPLGAKGATIPGTDICVPGRAIHPRIGPDEEPIFKLARRWLSDCQESHFICSELQNSLHMSPKLPTRLLCLKDEGRGIFLVDDGDWKEPYATLSHCWGSEQPITTKRDSFQQRQAGISMDDLPPTFRDAVIITRKLNIKYLWIDSLCIIQDDMADWENESAKMGAIYQNSLVTLAATAAKDSQGGCFIPREAQKSALLPPSFIHGEGQISACISSSQTNGMELQKIGHDSHLQQRGWTFQEKYLSPRIIHWDDGQIIWECYECRRAESGLVRENKKHFGKSLHLVQRAFFGTYRLFDSATARESRRQPKEFLADERDDHSDIISKALEAYTMAELPDELEFMYPKHTEDNLQDDSEGRVSIREFSAMISEFANQLLRPFMDERVSLSLSIEEAKSKIMELPDIEDDPNIAESSRKRNLEKCPEKCPDEWSIIVDLRKVNWVQTDYSGFDLGHVRESDDPELWTFLWSSVRFSKYYFWYDLVSEYTLRSLTYGDDKLPALSGMASLVQGITNDTYLGGHWRSDLEKSLFWMPTSAMAHHPNPSRPASYRGPSWAWSSVDGHIKWDYPDLFEGKESPVDFQILDVEVHTKGGNPFGHIDRGWLQVLGNVLTAKWDGYYWRVAMTVEPEDEAWGAENRSANRRNVLKDLRIHDSSAKLIGSWSHDHKLNALWPVTGGIEELTEDEIEALTARELWPNYYHKMDVTKKYLGKQGAVVYDRDSDKSTRRIVPLPEEILCLQGATRWIDEDSRKNPGCYEHDVLVLAPTGNAENEYRRVGVGRFRKEYWDAAPTRYETVKIV